MQERNKYYIQDVENDNQLYFVSLTEQQVALFNWLKAQGYSMGIC